MSKKLPLLGASIAAAIVACLGIGMGVATAGESTGNCHHADPGSAAFDNCKGPDPRVSNGNSICSFSGQNDHPEGSTSEGIGGVSQSYGQDVKAGQAFPDGTPTPPGVVPIDPSTQNKGHTDAPTPQPGYQCNGHANPLH